MISIQILISMAALWDQFGSLAQYFFLVGLIWNLSWRHSKHLFEIFEYPGTDFTTDHFKEGISLYLSLISYTYLERVVLLA